MSIKKNLLISGLIGIGVIGAVAVATTLGLYVHDASSGGSYGVISLRSYFHSGNGTASEPYVITRPRHLYNLSRLQGLGVFTDPKRAHFQLGSPDLSGDYEFACFAGDSSDVVVPFLDMESSTNNHQPINAIGSESTPFFGEFDGKGLEIKNLNVYADPQDAGLFGYTAHGSHVHDLFLDDIRIHTLGYQKTEDYEALYGDSALTNVYFTYGSTRFDTAEHQSEVEPLNIDASAYFRATNDEEKAAAAAAVSIPGITFTVDNSNDFKYKLLPSGSFVKVTANNAFAVDASNVLLFFRKMREDDTILEEAYPLQASTTVSLVASLTDDYGLDHSRVLMSLEFDFTLSTKASETIQMEVRMANEHGNNIGLVVGHSDGAISNCYVSKGSFLMNDGGNDYEKMANSSHLGLVGLVGGTVMNKAADDSGAGTSAGKDVGVIDFTTIYKDIVPKDSDAYSQGSTVFTPNPNSKYLKYLRYKSGQSGFDYVCVEPGVISFRGQTQIKENDLGIFSIATDYMTNGTQDNVNYRNEYSRISNEDASVDNEHYIYYETGEYSAEFHQSHNTGLNFSDYLSSFNSDNPSVFFPGHYLPTKNELSKDGFDHREEHQNYIFRFKLNKGRSNSTPFYLSQVDRNTAGGSFVAKYFNYKLIDQDRHAIPEGEPNCGVMIRDSRGYDLASLSTSFLTADWSGANEILACLENKNENNQTVLAKSPLANTVNFEITTEEANVTVVAGLSDNSKPAALGVYKLDIEDEDSDQLPNGDYYRENGRLCISQDYDNPDYAFFLPAQDHLAYFDCNTEGDDDQIGVYNSGVFSVAVANDETTHESTLATMPSNYNYSGEFGYSSGKTRLFAHTFKLKEGRYCLGSATGKDTQATGVSKGDLGVAKIFYVCAQGQTTGQISFDNNVFVEKDAVEDVDFIMQPRFTAIKNQSGVITGVTENIITLYYDEYNDRHYWLPIKTSDSPDSNKYLWKKRCYVSLANYDPPSNFAEKATEAQTIPNISFEYQNDVFNITTTSISAMNRVAVVNYRSKRTDAEEFGTEATNIYVSLFGAASSTADLIVYPYGN